VVEATGEDTDGDRLMDTFSGTYIMFTCESEDPSWCELFADEGYWEFFADGSFFARRTDSMDCRNL